jgi:dolichyl-phosphate-mannose--protein O-mannosyl transferase
MPSRWVGWLGAAGVTAIAAGLRLPIISTPRELIFDETYYVKDALSLLCFGHERAFVDKANELIVASNGLNPCSLPLWKDEPSYVVHPPVGKWIIAAGEWAFGLTPFGWRISVCLLGILAVLVLTLSVRRLTRSNLVAIIAGLLLATDTMAIAMSRTALLDGSLMFLVLVAFWFMLIDRDQARARMARHVRRLGAGPAGVAAGLGPRLGPRPWRWAAAIALGLACGVKWSGLPFVAALGLVTVIWDFQLRRAVGVRRAWTAMVLRDGIPAFFVVIGLALLAYTASWVGWFLSDDAYYRNWADEADNVATWLGISLGFLPSALQSWLHYHAEAFNFHANLSSEHPYMSNAWGWPWQARPTSFYFKTLEPGQSGCPAGTDKCASEVIALGNPIMWWAASLALIHQSWRWWARRDWRSAVIVIMFLAGWLPWLRYQERTIFTFYAIVMVPFMAAALAMTLGTIIGPVRASRTRRQWGAIAAGALLMVIVVIAWYFYPLASSELIPYTGWQNRMWFPTWI